MTVVKKDNLFKNINNIVVAGLSIYSIGILVYIAAYQLGYPYILEWMEGAMMDNVHRILEGKSIYSEPSIDFVPTPYAPVYFYLSAFFSLIFGPTIKIMRWISVLSTASILVTLYLWGKKETGSKISGVVSAGMFALVYWFVSEWFFLARVDMLSLAFFAWAAYLVRFCRGNKDLIYAGLLTVLSFLTKQNTLGLAVGLVVAGAFLHKRKILIYLFLWIVPIAFFTLIMNPVTEGRYWYYTMVMPMHHGVIETRYLSIFTEDISLRLLCYIVAAVICLVICFKKKTEFFFYFFLAGTLFISSYLMRLKVGGATNSYLPFFFGGALFMGMLFWKSRERKILFAVSTLLIIVQFSFLTYDFRRYIPDGKMRFHEHKLVEGMKEMKGSVWLVSTGHLSFLAGKGYAAHQVLIYDSLSNPEKKKEFSDKILFSFRKKKFDSIIVEDENKISYVLKRDFKKHYRKTEQSFHIMKWLGSHGSYFEKVYVYERIK